MVFQTTEGRGVEFQRRKAAARLRTLTAFGGLVRFRILPLSYLVGRVRDQHGYDIREATYLGQALAAALLLSASLKNQEKFKIVVEASGPGEGWLAEANALGEARGYLFRPNTYVDPVDHWMGEGRMTVTRFLEANGFHPMSSTISGRLGSIAQDFEHFLTLSDQVESRFRLGREWAVLAQPLPGCRPEHWEATVAFLEGLDPDSTEGLEDAEPGFLRAFEALPEAQVLDAYRVEFFCPCSRERFAAYLRGLPEAERRDILERGPFPLEVRCHYCNSVFGFDEEELHAILDGP